MLIDLSNQTELYQALLDRDERYDGYVFVGVSTTGVFCRLTCPARKPKPQNCAFFPTVSACIEAGFRPCKRCQPLQPVAETDPAITALLDHLEKDPAYRWSEHDLERMGYDPSSVRKSFKRQFGMTFLQLARERRLHESFSALANHQKVIDAQLSAGFESPSAFRTAFAKLVGRPPGSLTHDSMLKADWIPTLIGNMIAVSTAKHLHLLEFVDRKALPMELARLEMETNCKLSIGPSAPSDQMRQELTDFFAGKCAEFKTPLAMRGSEFTRRVWSELQRIPAGQTRTYSALANQLGRPNSTRAVARANGANQIAIAIPCHRVIGANGALTGYGGGLWRKQKLIEIEQHYQYQRWNTQ